MTKQERDEWLQSAESCFLAMGRNLSFEAAMWRCLLRWASGIERIMVDES